MPTQLFVPFASNWRPHAVAWGIFATYLLLAIQITSWTMRKLPRRLWHRVHVLSIPMFVMATVHGFLAGTDRANRALQWGAFVIGIGVIFLLAARLLTPSRPARGVPRRYATVPLTRRSRRPARSTHRVDGVRRSTGNERNPDMRVWIDQDLCVGNGICEELCPDVFQLTDGDIAYVRDGESLLPKGQDGDPERSRGARGVSHRSGGGVSRRMHLP